MEPGTDEDLAIGNVLVKGFANSAGTGKELCGHGFYLFAQADSIQICTEDIGSGVQLLQAGEVLCFRGNFQTGNDLLQLLQQRIGRGDESLAVVIDAG